MTPEERAHMAQLTRTVNSMAKAIEGFIVALDSGERLFDSLLRDLKDARARIEALEAASEAGEVCRRAARRPGLH